MVIINNWAGMVYCNNSDIGFMRNMISDPNILIDNIEMYISGVTNFDDCDTYVIPGASLELITKKIKEGYEVEFENEQDRLEVNRLSMKGGRKKKKKN